MIFGKYENLYFGDIPAELKEFIKTFFQTETASQWQDYVQSRFEELGYFVRREVWVGLEDNRYGRIDLVLYKEGRTIACELDYRTPRKKSIQKVKKYNNGMVLLRDPKIIAK